ncbi:FecR family protein [Pedobacter arcticus]|uniref:FecR family protein n=1 Tax=Pedobacter arcticus TaxID=752140 RepID=UPI000308E90F|nr:FecR family protein [Pedobacter arcticus]
MHTPEMAKRYNELSAKWLSGDITEAEEQELYQFYNEDNSDIFKIPHKFNGSEQDYKSFLYRIIQVKLVKDKSTYRIWMWSAAATILFAIGVLISLKTTDKLKNTAYSPKQEIIHNKKEVSAPVLILEDGSEINLSKIKEGTINHQKDVAVTKDDTGQLVYSYNNEPSNSPSEKTVYNEIRTPVGQKFTICLSDGTKVWLNAGSSLKFPVQFEQDRRLVQLYGEAYFEVAKNKSKPFKVITNTQEIEVLGTHFNVSAYENESSVKTTLLEGSVKINSKTAKQSTILKPGEQSVLQANHLEISQVDVEHVVAWKSGYFTFTNEDLESIMRKLERWYDIDVVFETGKNPNLIFAGKISQTKSISSVLKIIEETGNVHFKISGRRVTVMK